jgi:hypothetical protein
VRAVLHTERRFLARRRIADDAGKRRLPPLGDIVGDAMEKPVLERETICCQGCVEITFEDWIDFDDESA